MIEFVKGTGSMSDDCCRCCHISKRTQSDCPKYTSKCEDGYFVNVKRTRPRKSRDRRLLEALLRSVNIYQDGMVTWKPKQLTPREASEIIVIKQAMEKKGGG